LDGAVIVDKPEGWTSHDAVNKMRRLAKTKKVGHLGTLDPVATGVLPLLLNRATRLAQFFDRSEKLYEATIRFGYSTDSYDRTGTPTSPVSNPQISLDDLNPHLGKLRGTILQTPPPFSAKKVGGVPAYRLARREVAVELSPVEVTVFDLEVLWVKENQVRIRARCSPGTYVRSIAHDLGQAVGCGAHLDELRRLASGEFTLERARSIPELEELASEDRLTEAVIPAGQLLPEFPAEYLDDVSVAHVRNGRDFQVSPFRAGKGARYVKAVSRQGELVAVGEVKLPNLYHPIVVL